MASNVTATREATRRTHTYSFHREGLVQLGQLGGLITGHNKTVFTKNYGNILTLLDSHVDGWGLSTLLQFYDPDLRCFTFSGYQLAPTLEEYSHFLNIKIQHKVPFVCVPEKPDLNNIANALYLSIEDVLGNWKKNGNTHGFYMSFLVERAQELANKKLWEAFNALLAVLIYGIVMFPNIHKFVDLAAICLFEDKNPVPTLLADTYYSVHSRYGKGGAIRNCLPLLYTWFKSHLPTSGPFVTSTQKWHQRIMGLTGDDIVWCPTGMDVEKVITSCGAFDNVPLIGTKGIINYNPKLALRQLGFALENKPLDKEIFESVCFEKGTDLKGLEKVVSAWNDIHTSDQISLGEKNAVAKQAYTDWVENRVKDRLLPFPKVNPLYKQPPKVPIAIMPAENCIPVNMESTQLHEKKSDAQPKHCLVNQKKVELTHEAKMLKGGSSRVQKRARTEKGERDTTVTVEDHQKILKRAMKEAEEKLKREYREDLKAYKLKIERDARVEVKNLKKKLEEETTKRMAIETQLKGSHLR
ncbi:uncharacterized protein LOC131658895 [Vicia villosa]|uniref:uncharacterized protein LOC131658895 n=1 Tax=Vicia villosa TaxID=3911 RepID=UPI00273A860F|nr:uncharacterized protein LOC131658895 [Vicia villosa]